MSEKKVTKSLQACTRQEITSQVEDYSDLESNVFFLLYVLISTIFCEYV